MTHIEKLDKMLEYISKKNNMLIDSLTLYIELKNISKCS